MKRKLVKQGAATMMISLPAKWIKQFNLKKGDEIDLEESGDNLVISKDRKKTKKQIRINITDENRKDILVILTHLYRKGFDIITIEGINPKLLNEIKTIVNELLLGFEITEREDAKCRIENISEPTEQKYDSLLRRIFLIIKETHNIVVEDFQKNEFSHLDEIVDLRKQQDKFILFCRRALKHEKDPIVSWELLTFLMHIEHAYHYLYKYASENKIIKSKETINLLEKLGDYLQLYYDAYFKRDINKIHKINNLRKEHHFGKCLKLIEKCRNPVIVSYIRELFRLIQIGTSPVLSELFEEFAG